MKPQTITVLKEDYEKLMKKAEIADDALIQLKLSLCDLRNKGMSIFNLNHIIPKQ